MADHAVRVIAVWPASGGHVIVGPAQVVEGGQAGPGGSKLAQAPPPGPPELNARASVRVLLDGTPVSYCLPSFLSGSLHCAPLKGE
jgi:hypothetical protein